jgi:hypothetical protein
MGHFVAVTSLQWRNKRTGELQHSRYHLVVAEEFVTGLLFPLQSTDCLRFPSIDPVMGRITGRKERCK